MWSANNGAYGILDAAYNAATSVKTYQAPKNSIVSRFMTITGPTNEPITAIGGPRMVFHFGDPPASSPHPGAALAREARAFIVGQLSAALPVRADKNGKYDTFVAEFHPHAFRQFNFKQAKSARLVDCQMPLETLLGSGDADRLYNGLFSEPVSRRMEIMIKWLEGVKPDLEEHDIARAIKFIRACGGRANVDQVSEWLGVKRRSFERLFRAAVGLSPKRFARIVRCQRAARLCDGKKNYSLCDIAHLCGYADQAHMTREFVELLGMTPKAVVRNRYGYRQACANVPSRSSVYSGPKTSDNSRQPQSRLAY